jgi:L-methionine (R)-S-oxide reductase
VETVNYRLLCAQADALLSGQRNRISNAANLSALIFQELPDINWAGFYFEVNGTLMLGPFQGKPACVELPVGSGVCGTAAATGEIQRVANVHTFNGHIVCDTDSESELVVPLHLNGNLLGVLDIDSPSLNRFSAEDEVGLARLADIYLASID